MKYNRTTTRALIHVHIINYIIAIIYMHPYPITKRKQLYPQGHLGVWRGRVWGAIPCSSNIVQSAITQFCISDYPVSHLNSPTQLCISDSPMSHLNSPTQLCISDSPMSHLNSPTQLCISNYPASHLRRIMCSLGGPPQSTPRNKWTRGTLRGRMC